VLAHFLVAIFFIWIAQAAVGVMPSDSVAQVCMNALNRMFWVQEKFTMPYFSDVWCADV
jgi:hypothetical protein